ncbi:hypothetical protein EZ428_06075 [Pedobacter frigiditerrae]|uniref:Uncharacterized protein n=1 Tax=Pedobacter frigiditerrae TaxID=2530452 RepID=A0A4V2MJI1_9SPHI|nr:hypothetical protein [Pedobacter frigiditerrae]TCC94336.1 hypothetical protein EZ428_06075 [Pedobacter frigiditerrae]
MENLEHILLFKTDIKTEDCKAKLQAILDNHSDISKWNIALDDHDFVLRIISETLNHQQVIELINDHGHFCCELT